MISKLEHGVGGRLFGLTGDAKGVTGAAETLLLGKSDLLLDGLDLVILLVTLLLALLEAIVAAVIGCGTTSVLGLKLILGGLTIDVASEVLLSGAVSDHLVVTTAKVAARRPCVVESTCVSTVSASVAISSTVLAPISTLGATTVCILTLVAGRGTATKACACAARSGLAAVSTTRGSVRSRAARTR